MNTNTNETHTPEEVMRGKEKEALLGNDEALEALLFLLNSPDGTDLAKKALSKPRRNRD